METEVEICKEENKAMEMQVKTKDIDLQRLNIKIKRLDKTAEIREAIIANSVDTKITIENGIPNYINSVSPLKPAGRNIGEGLVQPRTLHEMKGAD